MVKTMEWQQNALEILDQTKLPVEISFIKCGTYRRVGEAIKSWKSAAHRQSAQQPVLPWFWAGSSLWRKTAAICLPTKK